MKKDITNEVFGNLIVKNYLGAFPVGQQGKTRGKWSCLCSCGKETDAFTGDLTSGKIKSCGCFGLYNEKGERICSICKDYHSVKDFYNKDSACKKCSSERRKSYTTREERNKKLTDAYPKHREKRLAYAKKYREDNLEKVTTNLKKWKQNNPNYKKEKWKSDSEFRLKEILRGRFYKAIKGYSKSSSILSLIGCTIPELKIYLQDKFTEGMSWDNYGEWHIDHKKPCASFDFSNEEEQKECFHYTNLQPLWALDNLIKGKTYTE